MQFWKTHTKTPNQPNKNQPTNQPKQIEGIVWWNLRRGRIQTKRERSVKWRWRSRDQKRRPELVSYRQKSTNICTFFLELLHISFSQNLKKTPLFFPTVFFCLKSNFCSITNCAYGPFTWQVCKEPNGLCWYTLLAENINIKHCVCPGTALNKETELLLRRPPKC